MKSFDEAVQGLNTLVSTVQKFEGFVIPFNLQTKIDRAKKQRDSRLTETVQTELSRVLAGFVKKSPTYFNGQVSILMCRVDEDLAKKLEEALLLYTEKIATYKEFSEAVGLYLGLVKYMKVIKAFQAERTQTRMKAAEEAHRRKIEAMWAAEEARKQHKARTLDYIRNGDFVKVDSSLPQ